MGLSQKMRVAHFATEIGFLGIAYPSARLLNGSLSLSKASPSQLLFHWTCHLSASLTNDPLFSRKKSKQETNIHRLI